jgi:protein TonB
MALRALLFSSDSSATSVLCEILTELSIEAEICLEILVAVERVSSESYDAILVDWDQEADATFLLKTAREQKAAHALNLALMQNDKEVGRALQQGANSVIKKPIDPQQAHDTLSTARDLILSRRMEQKEKDARVAAIHAEVSAAADEFVDDEPPAPKTGFLSQTAARSAFEAQTRADTSEGSSEQPLQWQAARGPDALREDSAQVQEIRPTEKKRWDDAKPLAKAYEAPPEEATPAFSHSADTTGVFSSLPEETPEAESEPRPTPHSQRLGFVLVACLLIAGVLYVWAPGDSYGGRLASLRTLFSNVTNASGSTPAAHGQATAADTPQPPPEPTVPSKTDDPPADPGPLVTTDVDPSKIQIIETKAIPKAGAQLPPATDPPAGSDQAQAQPDAAPTNPPAVTDPAAQPAATTPAPVQVAPQGQPQTQPPVQPQAEPQAPPALIPSAQPRMSATVPTGSGTAPSDGRTGVIIPDSLKTTPSLAPASSLEPPAVPEETSRDLVIHRVDPDYPAQALLQHLEGPVVLQVWVAKDGTIQDLKLVKGYFILGRAAFAAVKQWRFKAYTLNGKPIDFQTNITINFKYPG